MCVSSDSKGRNDDEDEDEVDDAVAAIRAAPLTEYGLQHGRYEEHCFAAKLVGEVARYDATCCDAQQKEHLGHVLHVLLVADQIPLRGPRVAQIVVRIVLPAAAGNQFATFRCCLGCLLLWGKREREVSGSGGGGVGYQQLPPVVPAVTRCSAASNRCRRASDNCSCRP